MSRILQYFRDFRRTHPAWFWMGLSFLLLNWGYSAYRTQYLASSDLAHGYLAPTRGILFEGKSPIRDFPVNSYPVFFYVVMAPLAPLPNWLASLVWSAVNTLAYVAIWGLLWLLTGKKGHPSTSLGMNGGTTPVGMNGAPAHPERSRGVLGPVPLAALAMSILFLNNLHLGQSNLLPLFCVVLGFYWLQDGKDARAGVALSFAAAYKLTPALFFALLFIRGKWKALGWALVGGLGWMLVAPILFFGWHKSLNDSWEWAQAVLLPFARGGMVQTRNISWYHTNQSLEAVLHRHLTSFGPEHYPFLKYFSAPLLSEVQAHHLATLLRVVVLIGLLVVWWMRRKSGRSLLPDMALGLYAMLLLSPASWVSHYISMGVAFTWVATKFYERSVHGERVRGIQLSLLFAALATLAVTSNAQALSLVFWGNLPLAAAVIALAMRPGLGDNGHLFEPRVPPESA